MIKAIKLHNFKCYKDEMINLGHLTVFCGNNSVGKSTAIQAITLLFQSRFGNEVPFNGDLISLGYYDDVHNCYVIDDETISVSLNAFGNDITWRCKDRVNDGTDFLAWDREADDTSVLTKLLDSFQYLQAERLGPRDNYNNEQSKWHKHWLGSQGQNTAEVLSAVKDNQRFGKYEDVDGNCKFVINKSDPRIHEKAKSAQIFDNISSWMQELSPGFSFDSKNERIANVSYNTFRNNDGRDFRPTNMGFGLSYSLSVVTALVNAPIGSTIIVENPEAHLHPRGQSYLGRLIALTAEAGVQVIVETHSDHLINGMRLMPRLGKVDCKKIKIYQVVADIENKCSKALPISVDEQGELSEWPDQFFDQQLIDMDILMSGNDQ